MCFGLQFIDWQGKNEIWGGFYFVLIGITGNDILGSIFLYWGGGKKPESPKHYV